MKFHNALPQSLEPPVQRRNRGGLDPELVGFPPKNGAFGQRAMEEFGPIFVSEQC